VCKYVHSLIPVYMYYTACSLSEEAEVELARIKNQTRELELDLKALLKKPLHSTQQRRKRIVGMIHTVGSV
jgi:hypothetical protein